MSNWFNSGTADSWNSLLKQAVSTVESSIDKVLDIHNEKDASNTSLADALFGVSISEDLAISKQILSQQKIESDVECISTKILGKIVETKPLDFQPNEISNLTSKLNDVTGNFFGGLLTSECSSEDIVTQNGNNNLEKTKKSQSKFWMDIVLEPSSQKLLKRDETIEINENKKKQISLVNDEKDGFVDICMSLEVDMKNKTEAEKICALSQNNNQVIEENPIIDAEALFFNTADHHCDSKSGFFPTVLLNHMNQVDSSCEMSACEEKLTFDDVVANNKENFENAEDFAATEVTSPQIAGDSQSLKEVENLMEATNIFVNISESKNQHTMDSIHFNEKFDIYDNDIAINSNLYSAQLSENESLKKVICNLKKELFESEENLKKSLTLNQTLEIENINLKDSVGSFDNKIKKLENLESDANERVKDEFLKELHEKELVIINLKQSLSNSFVVTEEKTNQVAELLLEGDLNIRRNSFTNISKILLGENLSKQELKSREALKKQKLKLNEAETELKAMTLKFNNLQNEYSEVSKSLLEYKEKEKVNLASMKKFTEITDTHAKEISDLEKKCLLQKEKELQLQTTLDNVNNEFADAKIKFEETIAVAKREALDKEAESSTEIHKRLEDFQKNSENIISSLRREIIEVRSKLTRVEDESGWKEDMLRKELSSLQWKLQSSESRNEDMASSANDSTKPLLRQLESLQNQHNLAQKNWEAVEYRLSKKFAESETEKNETFSKYKLLKEKFNELNIAFNSNESILSEEKLRNYKVNLELKAVEEKLKIVELKNSELKLNFENLNIKHEAEIKQLIEMHQKNLKDRFEEEKKKKKTSKELSIKEKKIEENILEVEKKVVENTSEFNFIEKNFNKFEMEPAVQRYKSQISQLKTQLKMAIQTRDELADEIGTISNQIEEMKAKVYFLETEAKENSALKKRYLLSLEILGEKTEQVEELKNDILDIKNIFKLQINSLCVISGNEKSVLLLTKEGNLLSFSSEDRQPQSADNHLYHLHNANYLKEKEAKMNGIKISNLYYSNKDKLENSRNSEGLFFTYENGEKFFLMKIEKNLLLCIIGNNNSQFGMLSMKV
ncbi:hypothetical protein HK099_003359 [Clydaea vesicula]|uniref:TATA element modulatory factor 1 TATA binding domain-containing protein n=1 Tax=Clydaea vesicula TaxID=447962 RepID=A0AAD5U1X2_9FUNG|nr:hypothetical protein HK099_003359 [Clydaea vesicula]